MKIKESKTKISKWGNGYGLRIPISILNNLSIKDDSEVYIEQKENYIKILPKKSSIQHLSLSDLLEGVSPSVLKEDRAELFFGLSEGNEIW